MGIVIDTDNAITKSAIEIWQISGQIDILQEEAGEVVTAVSRFRRGRATKEKIAEEIADVIVSSMSVIPALGIEEDVKEFIQFKLARLERIINGTERRE